MNPRTAEAISASIGAATGREFHLDQQTQQRGGCIHAGYGWQGRDGRRFFVKVNAAQGLALFEAEADGLGELEGAGAIRVPRPVTLGCAGSQAYLVLEWLQLGGREDAAELGRRLARLHRRTRPEFGWRRDNHIGATPQPNAPMPRWTDFFRERRLGFQLALARDNAAPAKLLRLTEEVMERMEDFFPGPAPVASLLHGDLWGGNHGYVDGIPVLFDPAVYYGDREADLAMTELFGGYPARFYAAYQEAWPLDSGYATRKHLYNLYHLINHFNLFGGGYAEQASGLARQLLAQVR